MASILFAVKCPHCGRSAFADDYYKTGEKFICCRRCGYNYSKLIKYETENSIEYKEIEWEGYGVILIVNKNGSREWTVFNYEITTGEIEELNKAITAEDVEQSQSYFVIFKDGKFTILFGNPTENFHLSFEEYTKKMAEKYLDYEIGDYLVPIEE